MGAIVVTWDSDFRTLIQRVPAGARTQLRRVSRIRFRCPENEGRARLEALMPSIEFEYRQARKTPDKRLLMVISKTSFVVER